MTFEEFFIKKKIDLDQLKNAEPALFEEFRYDFSQMGEKSFDHTKKFWFNKLRKVYHLKPVLKPESHKPEINRLARQAEPLSSPTIAEKPLYSPKFKPRVASQPKPESSSEKEAKDSLASSEHPVLNEDFSPKAPDKEVLSVPNPDLNTASTKPAYKPRFKAAVIKKEPEQSEEAEKLPVTEENREPISPASEKPAPKPAYKPRFNAAAIKKESPELDQPPPAADNNQEITPLPSEEPQAKPAYKPRFKPGMTNKQKPKDEAGNNDE